MPRRNSKERQAPTQRTKVKALYDLWTFLDMINFHGGISAFGIIHKELVDFYEVNKALGRRDLYLMPRGHLKTTIITVLNILHDIYVNPNIRIYVGSANKALAKAIMREVTANLVDPWLQENVWNSRPHIDGRLIPVMDKLAQKRRNYKKENNGEFSEWDDSLLEEESEFGEDVAQQEANKKVIWTQEAVQVLRSYNLKEPTLCAGSVDSPATGFHYDKVYFDDIINFDNYDKPDKVERLDTWRNDMFSVLDDELFDDELYDILCTTSRNKEVREKFKELCYVGGDCCVVGTRYFRHDWYKQLIDDDESGYRKFIRNIYVNGEDNTEGYIWAERWNEEVERKRRKAMSRKHFYAQYLNKVIVTEDQILPFDKIRFLHATSIEQRNDSPRVWIKGEDGEFVEVTLRMCIDPAATCNKDSDFTACVVGGKDEKGNLYVLDLKLWKMPVDKWVREMYKLLDKWHLKGIHLETVGWFVTMKDSIKKYFGEYYPISIRDYKPTSKTSKKERIEAGLEPLMTNGMLYMTSWCMTSQEVQDQFNFFPAETVHDDAPDVVQQLNEVSIKTVPLKKQQESNKVIKYNTRYGGVY